MYKGQRVTYMWSAVFEVFTIFQPGPQLLLDLPLCRLLGIPSSGKIPEENLNESKGSWRDEASVIAMLMVSWITFEPSPPIRGPFGR